jgi:hypothetical protein
VTVEILRSATSRARLASLAKAQFGDVVKAVVDVRRRVMAIGGELHSSYTNLLLSPFGISPGSIVTPPPGVSQALPPSHERWMTCPNHPLDCEA